MADKNEWGSNLSFILAMIGSAVGLGNIWRYPYVLYSNGGGAFYIPYIVAILLMGIPFLILEYGVGYDFKSSFPKAIRSIHSNWEFLGWLLPVAVFIIMIYYSAILGWDGIYMILSFSKGWGANPDTFFANTLLHSTDSVSGLLTFIPIIAVAMLVGWVIIWFVSHRDLEEGLGKVSKVLVPALFVIMVIIVGVSLTLPGASIGLAELFNPNWSLLGHFEIWMAAFGQIVFSLSLGMSIAFTYASYTKDDADLITNTISIALANSLFENFAALGVFSILGYMSTTSGTPMVQLVTEGTGLVFIVFPMIFNIMGPIGRILAPLLFLAILFAGVTSALGFFEPMLSSTSAKLGWSRKRTSTILSIIGCAFSLLLTTGISSYLVGIIDSFVNEFGILILIGIQCIIFAWFYGIEHFIPALNEASTFKVGKTWTFIIKYLLPLVLIVMWAIGIFKLFSSAKTFEIIIDLIIIISVMVAAFVLTKVKPAGDG